MKIHPAAFLLALTCTSPFLTAPGAQAQVHQPLSLSVPSVRGLEYRAVVLTQNQNRKSFSNATQPPVHLWIIPAHDDQPVRGMGWDGVHYDVSSVGAVADWHADVQAALKPRAEGEPYRMPQAFAFSRAPIALVFLDQLGAPELVRRAHGGGRVPLSNAHAVYHGNLRDAGVRSFVGGNFEQAKHQLETLLSVLPVVTPKNSFGLSDEAREILADIERRLHPTPRPTDEIAALIYDLQDVRVFQRSSPGSIGWTQSPTIQKLIDHGDDAVEPLLETLENDARLTLSVHMDRYRIFSPGSVATVRSAALAALNILLNHTYYPNYRLSPEQQYTALAAQIRADWAKVKGKTPVERVFQTLATSGETPERLQEAAQQLVRIGQPYNRTFIRLPNGTLRPKSASQTFFGEPLRTRQNPSVSDHLEARIKELSDRALNVARGAQLFEPPLASNITVPSSHKRNNELRAANALSWVYSKWEPKRALPLLGPQLELSKSYAGIWPPVVAEDARSIVATTRRQFLAARLHTPFRAEALREYSAYLQSQPFGRLPQDDYAPLWRFSTEPAIARAAHALFDAPRRPFQEAAQWKTGSFEYENAFRLLHSPLLKLPLFKAAVVRELKNRTVIGALRTTKNNEAELAVTAWDWHGRTVTLSRTALQNGYSQPIRVCDIVGYYLYENRPKNGQDRHYPLLDVSLPTRQRDTKFPLIIARVKTGDVVAEEFGFESFDF